MRETKVWKITISTHGDDITLAPGFSDEVITKQYVRGVFENGIWVGKIYWPPTHLISANIEQELQ